MLALWNFGRRQVENALERLEPFLGYIDGEVCDVQETVGRVTPLLAEMANTQDTLDIQLFRLRQQLGGLGGGDFLDELDKAQSEALMPPPSVFAIEV
ncbi:MAG: hypothetical protein K2Q10_10280 [Rhodospirillales bacterium]|nr:hypothetical protein [Rhodospirillales bacterium]